MIWCKHHRRPPAPDRGHGQERDDYLVREAEKAQEAQAAAAQSIDSIHAEAVRLRDSHAVARELREAMRENGWAERIALSMALRHKG